MAILRISNLSLLDGAEKTHLTAAPAAGATTLQVADSGQFGGSGAADFVLLGEFGSETSEIVQVTAAPTATTLTVGSLSFPHAINAPVRAIRYNQAEFSRAATETGSKTVLATVGIDANDHWTSLDDATYSTGFAFIRFYNNVSAAFSEYSGSIPYTGMAQNTVRKMKDAALALTHTEISDLVSEDFLLTELNNWQREVADQKDWDFELTSTTDTVVSGKKQYAVPTTLKHEDSAQAVLSIHIRNYPVLDYIDKREYETYMVDKVSTTLAADVALIDTTISLTDAGDFTDAGTILIGDGTDDEIDYTGKTGNTLTGVTGISDTHTSGATVWQSNSLSKPVRYTIFNGEIYLEPVASSTYHGETIHYDYWRSVPELASDTDTTIIPFWNLAQYYLSWKIEERKGNAKEADRWRQIWENRLAKKMRQNRDRQYFSFKVWRGGSPRSTH